MEPVSSTTLVAWSAPPSIPPSASSPIISVIDRWCCWASTSVGASIAAWPPASTTVSMARRATIVFPEPDLALEQPVHRVFRRQVVEDLLGDLLLALGEGEGEFGVEGGEQAVRGRSAGHRGELGVGVAAAGEGDLEDERLVPLEAGARVVDVRLGVRAVDLQQGLGER